MTILRPRLPDDFDPQIVSGIRKRLDDARKTGVKILFAIESGSRAWGFPSPDSDYDCRFVYARNLSDHLLLQPPRDVIEFPIEGDLDVGGWDLRKALLLALNGNAVIWEWTDSRICYEELSGTRDKLKKLLGEIIDPSRVAHHYLGLARSTMQKHQIFDGDIKLKKLFYILRPLMALSWMEQNGYRKIPPMDFNVATSEVDIETNIKEEIAKLLEAKSKTRELGTGTVPNEILNFIKTKAAHFESCLPTGKQDIEATKARLELAQSFYDETVQSA